MRAPAASVGVLAVAGVACHRPAAAALNPRAEVAVTVDNQNFLDMDVFIIRGGQRLRLGMVSGLSSRILMVRPELIGYGTEVQFEVHPIGGPGKPLTHTISGRPRGAVSPIIPSSLAPQQRSDRS